MRWYAVQRGAFLVQDGVDDGGGVEDRGGVDDAGAVRPGGEVAEDEAEAVEEWGDVA